jgi:hypothetical protein
VTGRPGGLRGTEKPIEHKTYIRAPVIGSLDIVFGEIDR